MVVGGASGIGRAVSEAFVGEGCRLSILDRHDQTHQIAKTICAESQSFIGDATDYESIKKAFAEFGKLDHMVYAVGGGSGKFGFPFWNLEPSDWARVIEINLMGAVHAAHAFAPDAAARNHGTMLFFTSIAGQIGSQTDPPYSASKAGVINFMQCAARDLAPHNVRANALSPGMVQTDLNRSVWEAGQELLPESQRQDYETWGTEKVKRTSPMGRWQTPEEYGSMAVYLASEHARNITGQVLNIDGGQVMHS